MQYSAQEVQDKTTTNEVMEHFSIFSDPETTNKVEDFFGHVETLENILDEMVNKENQPITVEMVDKENKQTLNNDLQFLSRCSMSKQKWH